MRYLSRADTERLGLRMSELLPIVERAFAAVADRREVVAPRVRLVHPALAPGARGEGRPWQRDVRIIPGGIEDVGIGIRLGSSLASDTGRAASGELLVLIDWKTMEISALISDRIVHAVRSTVADGIFAQHLARSGSHRIAVLGSGRLARWAAEAVVAAVGAREVAIWSPTAAHREDAAAFLGRRLSVRVEAAPSAERAVRESSIVVTATTSSAPVLRADWVARGATLISNRPEEFDAPLFALGRVFTTYVAGVLGHVPPYRGLPDDAPLETLADIVTRRAPGRRDDDEILVCVNPAYGVLDAVVASFVHQRAVAAGVGVELDP